MSDSLSIPLLVTAERLREVLSYNSETGLFFWKHSAGRVKAGDAAGNVNHGHVRLQVDKREYWAHRLAWLYMYGEWPKQQIDHINGIRSDNRIANLRDVSRAVNQQNQRRPQSDNKTSQFLGVSWRSRSKRWRATITLNKKHIEIGLFDTQMEAHEAYKAKKREIHPGCTI